MLKNNWFEIRKGDDTVYAVCEHKHAQWVHSFLILGEKRSVLFDTGLGVCNIQDAIMPYLKTPLMVVNSHAHFDHIGNDAIMEGTILPEPVELPCGDSFYNGKGKRAVLPHCSVIYR